jgi:hypothetical protein
MANYGVCFRFPQTVNTVVTHWCGEFKEVVQEVVQVVEEKIVNKKGKIRANKTTE